MKNLICYIPFFVRRGDAYAQLEQTIRSLRVLSTNLLSIHVVYCQPEEESGVAGMERISNEINTRFAPHLISIQNPLLLPTAAYRFMQTDGKADDSCFYVEADHIVQAKPGFLDHVLEEIKNGSVVMPHRLGTRTVHKNREPVRWGNFYVGNYAAPNIHAYSDIFNAVTGYYNAYAGAYFAHRSVIQKNRLSFPLTTNIVWRGMVEHARRFSGGRLFGSQAPHGLLLEAPSSIFQANHQCVLKPFDIENLYVIHLSLNGGV